MSSIFVVVDFLVTKWVISLFACLLFVFWSFYIPNSVFILNTNHKKDTIFFFERLIELDYIIVIMEVVDFLDTKWVIFLFACCLHLFIDVCTCLQFLISYTTYHEKDATFNKPSQ